jgi:hypothetical protein
VGRATERGHIWTLDIRVRGSGRGLTNLVGRGTRTVQRLSGPLRVNICCHTGGLRHTIELASALRSVPLPAPQIHKKRSYIDTW